MRNIYTEKAWPRYVQTLYSAIHRINHYPVDKYQGVQLRNPLDRLRVAPHFSSGIVERAKREPA